MLYLFFDTETTGKALFGKPATDAGQPHLMQLAMVMANEKKDVLFQMSTLVRIGDAHVEPEAEAVHGISGNEANEFGLHPKAAASIFERFAKISDMHVGHNIDFDQLIMQTVFERNGLTMPPLNKFCTMRKNTNVLKLPGSRGYKWPKLIETYNHYFGRGFEDAHDAMADCRACMDIFFAMEGNTK